MVFDPRLWTRPGAFEGRNFQALPRINVRKGFTRPMGDINAIPLYILRGLENGKPQTESCIFSKNFAKQ
jgi:hypothetical protein